MQTVPMFLDEPLRFDGQEKHAGTLTPMGDNADQWPIEVTDEAYRQLPFLSDFEVHASMDKVDEERGYALGSLEVRSRSNQTAVEMKQTPLKSVQIPFVIREKRLAPLDVFIDNGKYHHLTEGRLRASLFRANTFDSVRDRPAQPNLYADLQPPLEANTGLGGGGVKLSAAQIVTPLLPQLHGRVSPRHIDRVKEAMADSSLRAAYLNAHKGAQAAFQSALQLSPSNLEKTAEAAWSSIKPDTVQLRKLSNGNYLMKVANSEMYAPNQEEVPPEVAEELLSDLDMTAQMESDGTITASPDAAVKQTLDAEEIRVVDQPGVWKVQDKMGNTLTGWAFPQLLSFDLQPMPLTLFTNGSEYAMQEHVAGSLLSKGTDLPKARMQGYGCLYYLDHANPKVFVPMTVRNSYRGTDGQLHYTVLTDLDEELDLVFADGIKTVVRSGDDQFIVPASFAKWWMPLKAKTELVSAPLLFTKYASSGRHASGRGEIISDGTQFSFRGAPFAKIASSQVQFLDRPDAEFVAVAAGVDPGWVKTALDNVAKEGILQLEGLRVLQDPLTKIAEARRKVASALKDCPVRNYNLIKEAAVLDDALTADKILGLGFLNAENVSTFVDMLPGLEYALCQIAEMLMASRLGLKDIPEVALERMMVALEDVIQGLRTLKQREVSYVEA